MKRLFILLLTMMAFSVKTYAEQPQAASNGALPTMSMMMCKDCPQPAAGQSSTMAQTQPGASMAPMNSSCCTMCDALYTMLDVMKMQQKLIASGAKNKKAVAEIDRKISEAEKQLASMKNMQMPCKMGMGSMQGMQGMPCANGKPCPMMPQPPAAPAAK
jgi:hypothetical protein